jgi:hypothetical protein
MEAKEQTDTSIARRAVQSRAGRIAIKTAGWVVAIPALCALVVIGGAAPIYLLLPDAAPVAEDATSPAAIQVASNGSNAPGEPTSVAASSPATPAEPSPDPAVSGAAEPADAAPPAEETAEVSPPEDAADDAPLEDAADASPPMEDAQGTPPVTVVPTARPRQEMAGAPRPAADAREVAALKPAPRETPSAAADTAKPQQASRPTKRYVTIRPVALRSGPGGREVAMLGRGAEVLAGACSDWCEVSAGGVKGWIHPSFLSASVPRERARRAAPRTIDPYDDEPPLREEARRYERRRDAAPDWFLDDDRPLEIYDYDRGR